MRPSHLPPPSALPFPLPSRPFNNIVRKTIIYLKMDAATHSASASSAAAAAADSINMHQLFPDARSPPAPPLHVGPPRKRRRESCDHFWSCGRDEACLCSSQLAGKTPLKGTQAVATTFPYFATWAWLKSVPAKVSFWQRSAAELTWRKDRW